MREYTREELNKIVENHRHWILEDCDGWEHMRANLSGADLSGANLYGTNLYRANLYGTNLYRANLYRANLYGANLSRANLYGADLSGAVLPGANLYRANLHGANLYRANLHGANLPGANLYGANLSRANLYGADLSGAVLPGANLSGAENVPFTPMACPDTGEFTAWKKCESGIVKLLIPEDAKRLSSTGRKCRADKAVVLDIQDVDGNSMDCKETRSFHDDTFIYRVGETVVPKEPFCEDRWQECSSGIHFYINREEAVMH